MCVENIFFKTKKMQKKLLLGQSQLAFHKCKMGNRTLAAGEIKTPEGLTLLRRHVPNISRKRLMASILSIVRYNSASVHRNGTKIPPFDSKGNNLFEYLNIILIQSNFKQYFHEYKSMF